MNEEQWKCGSNSLSNSEKWDALSGTNIQKEHWRTDGTTMRALAACLLCASIHCDWKCPIKLYELWFSDQLYLHNLLKSHNINHLSFESLALYGTSTRQSPFTAILLFLSFFNFLKYPVVKWTFPESHI